MTLIRTAVLAVPLAAVLVAAWRVRPDRRARGAALLAFAAAAVGVAALNVIAVPVGWWSYQEVAGSVLGMPVDLWLGWAILWGPLPVLVRAPLPVWLLALLWLDLLTMPRLAPLVTLGPQWWIGDLVGLALIVTVAVLLGRWCADARFLRSRAVLQFVVFAGLLGWLGPSVAIDQGDGDWGHLTSLAPWQLSLVLQGALLLGVPGFLAMREFAERGNGTPYPWDPPTRLVTTGPYAYVANPMQCSAVLLTGLIAVIIHSWALAGGVVFAVVFSAAVAGPHEHDDLSSRHGAAWAGYRREVRAWRPRWRPYLATPARLNLAASCDVCSSTAAALGRLAPTGLALCAAEDHREALTRARYEGPDGYHADGVAAVARGLEHVNLSWALVGWILRIPLLDRLAQVIVDGLGGAPRDLPQTTATDGDPAWPTPGRS